MAFCVGFYANHIGKTGSEVYAEFGKYRTRRLVLEAWKGRLVRLCELRIRTKNDEKACFYC